MAGHSWLPTLAEVRVKFSMNRNQENDLASDTGPGRVDAGVRVQDCGRCVGDSRGVTAMLLGL